MQKAAGRSGQRNFFAMTGDTEQFVLGILLYAGLYTKAAPPAAPQGQDFGTQELTESSSIYENQLYCIKIWHLGPSAF